MVAHIKTVSFQGLDVQTVDVQVLMTSGLPKVNIVGLPERAVGESKERVRGALASLGLMQPPAHVSINLAPADLSKEGTHFDLPIVLALLVEMEVLPPDCLDGKLAMGELGLDGSINPVLGALPAAIHANRHDLSLICPEAQGNEAAWAGKGLEIIAPRTLLSLMNHLMGRSRIARPEVQARVDGPAATPNMRDIKGQETTKRALEITAAGGHNLLLIGPPGAGKSMLSARLPGLLPPLNAEEALSVTMVHSLAGTLTEEGLVSTRPYRDPHHSASLPALVGGGTKAKPGEVTLAHLGVLFLDELPEFDRRVLEALRQPIETGTVTVSRANAHVTYPAHFQLIAAMNPCRCGYLADPARACSRAPRCGQDYQAKISGPLYDRIDLVLEVPAVSALDLTLAPAREGTAEIAERVRQARERQAERFTQHQDSNLLNKPPVNASLEGDLLEQHCELEHEGQALITEAAEQLNLSARGFHRLLRVARTIADLENEDRIKRLHIAEALSFRRTALA
ncbi:MAG: ATP-binding protein [Alphaproteobacteria bacterium TMED89]|nr:AAA family ATPase [Rhodospirillaceae bacterium]RPH09853.1 MAG: ATP-binding protein [Alphaproteobacteria bacterium TMED89]